MKSIQYISIGGNKCTLLNKDKEHINVIVNILERYAAIRNTKIKL
jgi:hypothetical protein